MTAITDAWTITRRNTIKLWRAPDLLGSAVITPIMFVLLFAYIFGNMISIPGVSFRQYMMPGIFVETTVFTAVISGYILVGDLQKGIIDRFRTLPMAPSAVLVGRTLADLLINVISIVVMALMGLVVGWRIHTSPLEALGGFALLLLFSYALSWLTVTVALSLRTPEVFNNISSVAVFPLVFLANTFVDTTKLPAVLRPVADWNPVSAFTQAVRESFGNAGTGLGASPAWPLRHAVLASVLWSVVLLAVFVPLATWRYKKAVSR
jgi:ABC-2 type transport system permease protein